MVKMMSYKMSKFTVKISRLLTPKNCCTYQKKKKKNNNNNNNSVVSYSHHSLMHPRDADVIANSENPDVLANREKPRCIGKQRETLMSFITPNEF